MSEYGKTTNNNKKRAKVINRLFTEEETQRVHMNRCLTLLIIREKQIKATMKCYFTSEELTEIRKSSF